MGGEEARLQVTEGSVILAAHASCGDEVFAGTVKAFTAHKEGDRVGWISSPATHQLYASDVYVHGSMIEGFGHGDVVSFAVHVNNKGKPQACNGTVARLAQATGCTT